jgi:hypothetical protein
MSNSLEQIKLESAITVAFYKHRGDVSAIAQELQISFDYIRRVTDKLRRKMKRNVSVDISVSIMQTLWMGYLQRTSYLNECLAQLKGKEVAEVSLCCNKPVKWTDTGDQRICMCLKCGKSTHIHTIQKKEIYELIRLFSVELREEDKNLVDFADKMGFTFAEKPPVIKEGPVFVLGNMSIAEDDKSIVSKFENMKPIEREKIRKELEQNLLSK